MYEKIFHNKKRNKENKTCMLLLFYAEFMSPSLVLKTNKGYSQNREIVSSSD